MVRVLQDKKSAQRHAAIIQNPSILSFTVKYHLVGKLDPMNFNTYLLALNDKGDMLGSLLASERHEVVLADGYLVEENIIQELTRDRVAEYVILISVDRSIDPCLGFHMLKNLQIGVSGMLDGVGYEMQLMDLPMMAESSLILCHLIRSGVDWICDQQVSAEMGGMASFLSRRKPQQNRYSEWL